MTGKSILNIQPLRRIRQNHALEHATLQVLAGKHPKLVLAGYSDASGFWILGDVETGELLKAVEEARQRMLAGEKGLAVHPHCGTNFALSGLVAGTAAWAAMLPPAPLKKRADRWSLVVVLVTLAFILTAPLGPMVQANITTEADMGDLQVKEIVRYPRQNMVTHRVRTKGN